MKKCLFCTVLVIKFLTLSFSQTFAQADTVQRFERGRANEVSQQDKPYLILISADGFRYDYADKFDSHNLKRLREQGVYASQMAPSFPSLTFPNHYSIVTGMRPATHGLVGNSFYDKKIDEVYSLGRRSAVENAAWYGGVPIWTLAEQQGMLSASFYWVGSEAPIQGVRPSYYYLYNEKIPIDTRIRTVIDWLELPEVERPHLITFYLPEVDHAGHSYGPESDEVRRSVHFVDSVIGVLDREVSKLNLPVNFIFVSDHGMLQVNQDEPIKLPAAVDTADFRVVTSGSLVNLYAKNKSATKAAYRALKGADPRYKVYLKSKLPRHLHYSAGDDRYDRIGDIVMIAEAPYVFQFSDRRPIPGYHGYDAKAAKEMMATFIAWGPQIRRGKKLKSFDNVHLYPVMAALLGLEFNHTIDGRTKLIKRVLE